MIYPPGFHHFGENPGRKIEKDLGDYDRFARDYDKPRGHGCVTACSSDFARNDQVATDLRLWLRDAMDGLDAGVQGLQETLAGETKPIAELWVQDNSSL